MENSAPEPAPPMPWSARSHLNRARPADSGFRTMLVVVFAVVIPFLAILVEFGSHPLAGMYMDPIPTGWHVLILFLVPVCIAATEVFLVGGTESEASTIRTWPFVVNAYATTVSLLYLIAFIPFIPFATVGVLAVGLGFLPLSPLFCTIAGFWQLSRLRARARALGLEAGPPVRRALLGAALALVPLALLFVPGFVTRHAISLALSGDPEERARGIEWIRTLGAEERVLERCYGFLPGRGLRPFFDVDRASFRRESTDRYRDLYFRITGTPFNAVPPPSHPRLAVGAEWRDAWRQTWVTQGEIGGAAVAGRIRDLSLFGGTMEARVEHETGIADVEWTLTFKNQTALRQEARAQILLPPGGVATRLTLWIDDQPRQAAFGTRRRTRRAYRDVAVVQRRDPALLTTAGIDRVLLQCFPIEAGGALKVRVGITAPVVVRNRTAYLRLPRFTERNFTIPSDVRHELWIESRVPVRLPMVDLEERTVRPGSYRSRARLSEHDLRDPSRAVLELPAPAVGSSFEGWFGQARARITWRTARTKTPDPIYLVIDGSATLGSAGVSWTALLDALPPKCSVNALLAGQTVEAWADQPGRATPETRRAIAQWIAGREFAGGCDPVPALQAAWDRVSTSGNGGVIWIHGPLPVALSDADGLLRRMAKWPGGRVLGVSVAPGPNRLIESLGDPAAFEEFPLLGSRSEALSYLAGTFRTADSRPELRLDPGLDSKDIAGGDKTRALLDHLVRLAAYDRVRSLSRTGREEDLDTASRLAVSMQLVTPLSGAVVLETKEQYARHDLDPSREPTAIPGIPEPEEWALMLVALLGLAWLWWRHRAG